LVFRPEPLRDDPLETQAAGRFEDRWSVARDALAQQDLVRRIAEQPVEQLGLAL
jgi:hypothetical protein